MFDYIIKNGVVVDGSGNESFRADIAIENGSVSKIGNLDGAQAVHTIEADGAYVTPGFIDIHRHADAAVFREKFGEAELSQGLTTVINGNCGLSVAPFGDKNAGALLSYVNPIVGDVVPQLAHDTMGHYLSSIHSTAINCGMMAGSGTIRADLCGFDKTVLDQQDYLQIAKKIDEALCGGAFGVSLGVGYAPDCLYDVNGFTQVLAPLANTDIPFAVHMRNEGDGLIESFEEIIAVAKALHCPVEISHLKGMGVENWNQTVPEVLRRITRYRDEGVDVRCDFYPYTAGSTQLLHIMPPDTLLGGMDAWKKRLSDASYREELRQRFPVETTFENIVKLATWDGIYATSVNLPKNKSLQGKNMTEIGEIWGMDPLDACCQLLVEENGEVAMIDFMACEEDINRIASFPCSSLISDAIYPSGGKVHPRLYGAFVHFLEAKVSGEKILTIEKAIEKMTSLPALALRIPGKGFIKEGMDADICIFRLENLHENATYADPYKLCSGMDYVMVNGNIALDHGEFKNMTGGKVLKRSC